MYALWFHKIIWNLSVWFLLLLYHLYLEYHTSAVNDHVGIHLIVNLVLIVSSNIPISTKFSLMKANPIADHIEYATFKVDKLQVNMYFYNSYGTCLKGFIFAKFDNRTKSLSYFVFQCNIEPRDTTIMIGMYALKFKFILNMT